MLIHFFTIIPKNEISMIAYLIGFDQVKCLEKRTGNEQRDAGEDGCVACQVVHSLRGIQRSGISPIGEVFTLSLLIKGT
jgi:hypothetical protein